MISQSVGLGDRTLEFVSPTHSHVMLMLLIWETHFEDLQPEMHFQRVLTIMRMHIVYHTIKL